MFKRGTNQWNHFIAVIGATLLLSSCTAGPAKITQGESAGAIAEVAALN